MHKKDHLQNLKLIKENKSIKENTVIIKSLSQVCSTNAVIKYEPNRLGWRNVVFKFGLVWSSDIFDVTFQENGETVRVGVCLIMESTYNQRKKLKKSRFLKTHLCLIS